MPASALLKFTQGATVGGDGRALVGVLTTSVAISNVNNVSVASWQIEIAYADPTSAIPIGILAFNESSSTPAANFVPDVRRSYRVVLKVWSVANRAGAPDSTDIRVFTVRELNGAIIPPSQVWPPPLPDPRSGELTAKPNEMNFDGQLDGWHGTGVDGMMNQLLAKHMPPLPGSSGEVLTVVGGRWTSAAPALSGGDVVGPASAVDGNVALFDLTTGKLLKDSGLSLSAFIRHNGSVAFTANQSMGGFKLTNVANGVAAGDVVNYGQLQAAINGLDPKGNVRAYSNTNEVLSGLGALGGVGSFIDGQRVGLGGQTDPTENGIWIKHAGAYTRPADFAAGMDVSGAYFIVEEGTFADREFLVSSDTGSAVVGTNNLVLQDFGSSTISAGNGLQKIGNAISVMHDGATLSSSGSGLKVAAGGITGTELATGSVDLASVKVTGLLPFANIANGSAASVFGRSANSVGVQASIASSADGQVLRRAAGVIGWGALDLADTDGVTGLLPHANLANLAGLSVFGRSANTTGVMAAITGADGQVLRVAGTALGFGQVVTAGITDSNVTLAKLANGTASSVLGRSAATGGAYGDIVSSADGQVLRRGASGVLGWGAVDLADPDAITGLLPYANIASGAAASVLGRSAGTAGVLASIAAAVDGHVLQRVGGALVFAALGAGGLGGGTAVGQVLVNDVGNVPTWGALDLADPDARVGLLPHANIADGAALSVFGRSVDTAGVMAPIAGTDGQVLRVAGTVLAFGQIVDAGITTGTITLAKLANATASSVLGRSAATGGAYADIASSADGQVLRRGAAGVIAFGAVDLADADAITGLLPFANIANGTATSVFGRSAGTGGVQASIVATVDGQVLRRAGGALGWGAINLADGTNAVTGLLALANLTGGSAVGQVLVNGASNVPAWGALDLADADAVTGLLPYSNLANLAALSVLGRSADTAGVMAAITGADGQVLRVSGTTLGFGTIAATGLADGSIPITKLASATASSVLGRSAATGGPYGDIVSSADGQVLRRGASGVLAWGALDLADADAITGLLPHANLANLAGLSVLGRGGSTSGVMAAITGAANQILRVDGAGTSLGFGSITGASITDATIPLAKLANATAASLLGRSAATTGVYADIASSADGQVMRRSGGVLAWGAVDLADTDAVTGLLPHANITSLAALSVFGRAANTVGVMAAITGADGQVLRVSGTTLGFGTIAAAAIADGTLPLTKLVNGSAASLLGRSAATSGAYADIVSSADGQVMRRAAGILGWGAIDLADADAVTGLLPLINITGGTAVGQVLRNAGGNVPAWGALDLADADAVTGLLPHANLASLAGLSVFGRSASTSGVMAAITGTANQVLRVASDGLSMGFGALSPAAIVDGTLPIDKLVNATGASVIGRSTNTAGAFAEILSSADGQVLRRAAGGTVGWGAIDLADTDAVSGLLAFANIANGTATSVFGRTAGTAGVMASIAASADGQVLRRAGGVLAWGAVDLADTDAVTGLLAYANITSLAALSVFGRSSNSVGVMAAITASTPGHLLQLNAAGTALTFGQLQAIAIDDNTIPLDKLLSATGASVIGRSPNTVGDWQELVSSADGQVFRRASGSVGWGALDLADVDAVTGLLPGTNVNPAFGTGNISTTGFLAFGADPADAGRIRFSNGDAINWESSPTGTDVLGLRVDGLNQIILGNEAAVSHILSPSSGGVHVFTIGGSTMLSLSSTVLETGSTVVRWRFPAAVSGGTPVIHIAPSAVAAAVGLSLEIAGQDVTGTGATIGGTTYVRAGNSVNGTGGVLELLTGTGPTAEGLFRIRSGGTTFFEYPGTLTTPATTGILRMPHGVAPIVGRSTGAADRNGVSWGVSAVDTWNFGDVNEDTVLTGTNVFVDGLSAVVISAAASGGAVTIVAGSDVHLQANNLGGRAVLSLFGIVTTTQMPANTGDGVLYWAEGVGPSTAAATGAPVGGCAIWNDAQYGLQTKSKYNVETTLAVRGANATVKRRLVEWKSDLTVYQAGTTAAQTTVSIDVSNFNGQALADGTLVARGKCVCFNVASGVSNYAGYAEVVAVFKVNAGVITQQGNTIDMLMGGGIATAAIDFSGSTIRMRVTLLTTGVQLMSYIEVHGAENGN